MQTTSNGSAAVVTTLAGVGQSPSEHIMKNGAKTETPSFESNVILRRPETDQTQVEYGENHLSEFGNRRSPEEDPDRTTPESLSETGFAASNEDCFDDDDDGQSSVCSEMIFCGGGGGGGDAAASIPTKYSTLDRNFKMRKTESLVEALEKQRRESVGNRLKELHKRRTSLFTAIDEMPVIAKRSPSGDNLLVLPRQTRRSSYQSVIAGPSFLSSSAVSSQSRLFGSAAALARLERRNSITGSRVQTPTRLFFPLRETESLSGMEHFVEPSEQLTLSTRRLHAPSQFDADRTPSGGLSTAYGCAGQSASSVVDRRPQPIETATRCNNDEDGDDDDTVKSVVAADDDSESKRSYGGDQEPAAESNKETDRRCKAYEEKNDEAEGLSAVPSISDEGSSCEGIASTEYSADIRINRSSSSSSSPPPSSSSLSTSDGAKHGIGLRDSETPHSVLFHEDDKTNVRRPTFGSKAEEYPTDIGVCPAEAARRFGDAEPKTDEVVAKKSSAGVDCIVSKGDAYGPQEKIKYYSDIRIQLKDTHSSPSRNYGGSEASSPQNGNLPAAVSNECKSNDGDDDDDDDDDDDGGESDAEIAKNIVPNWSSYPGPLLNSSAVDNYSHFEDESVGVPKRNISTLAININSANSDNSDRRPADRLNACRSVQTVSQVPTGVTGADTDDRVNGHRSRDSDLSYYSHVYPRRDVKERSTRPEDPLQASFDFIGNRPNASQTNDCRRGLDGNCSTERQEVFLVESCPVNARAQALPRRDQRSRNPPNNTRGGSSCDDGFPQRNGSLASQHGERRENRTLRGHESTHSPTDAVLSSCSRAEGARPPVDHLKTRPATAVNGGMSESPAMHLKPSGDQRTEGSFKSKGKGGGGGGSSEPPPPPSSVERIWESVEEPRPRMLRRKIRFEPDPESLPPSADGRRSRASSSDSEPAKGDAERTRTTIRSLSTEENEVRHRNASAAPEADGELLDIDVPKGGLGLGFCIEGGKDGPYGDRPITVKRLFRVSSDPKASGASEATLRPGDEIISANGRDMTLLSRYVAWNYLKTLPDGTIKLVIRRRKQ